jgi:hypothetical protein
MQRSQYSKGNAAFNPWLACSVRQGLVKKAIGLLATPDCVDRFSHCWVSKSLRNRENVLSRQMIRGVAASRYEPMVESPENSFRILQNHTAIQQRLIR